MAESITFNEDCMEVMARYPGGAFDLAVVDPPYGIGDKFKGGKTGKMNFNEIVEKRWDKAPADDYFKELFRVSKKSIIWGGKLFPASSVKMLYYLGQRNFGRFFSCYV